MTIVIRGGTVIDAGGTRTADVAVDEGRIVDVGPTLDGDRVIDAGGCVVCPGLVDLHAQNSPSLGAISQQLDVFDQRCSVGCWPWRPWRRRLQRPAFSKNLAQLCQLGVEGKNRNDQVIVGQKYNLGMTWRWRKLLIPGQ